MSDMKYTIELTEKGCKETLSFVDPKLGLKVELVKTEQRTDFGSESKDNDFSEQLRQMGFSEEIIEKAEECFDSMMPLYFMELAEEMEG